MDDTIAAISTPVGQGGIGIVRMSGPGSITIAKGLFIPRNPGHHPFDRSHCLVYGHIIDPSDRKIMDEVLLSVMKAPCSYTKEDVVEINCHGGMVAVRKVLEMVISQGARLSEPGEFTKRAFLNGRISLPQAEAVMDLISAMTDESMRIAADQLRGNLSERLSVLRNSLLEECAFAEAYIDFPEEEIEKSSREELISRLAGIKRELDLLSETFQESRFFREGLATAIVGRPNVGKSSLLNALLNKDRAIVTEVPGTTRDLIEDYLNIKGLPVRIIDTAGIRSSEEMVEREGIRRSLEAIENADFVIAMFDGSQPFGREDMEILSTVEGKKCVIVINKSDLPSAVNLEELKASGRQCLRISALAGEGLEELKTAIFDSNLTHWNENREGLVVTNLRHRTAIDRASASLGRAGELLLADSPLEIFSIELRDALDSIGEITGAVTTEDILNRIFSDFCIGK